MKFAVIYNVSSHLEFPGIKLFLTLHSHLYTYTHTHPHTDLNYTLIHLQNFNTLLNTN